ncbi:uncharacterized protein LOC110660243 isoform X2 [Hevea brasiliensis]|uniref:uncharacterized protein LOC110660243 isoform X2 n=1 Tax=Hevea brasiliensis TaxID=3981 RepID=UPI0025D7C808|nr:uncharacterized protein LOC110660243 isoform X2 [Hevea brasiliensis]
MKLNSHWDPLNLNTNVTNSNKDGTNLVSKEVKWSSNGGNSVLVADNWGFDNGGDDDDDNGREFKDAEPKTPLGDEISKDDERMPENFEGALYIFGFGNGIHGQSDFGFDFNSSYKNKQNDIENKLHYPQVDAKAGSDEHSWAFKDAFSEAGSKGNKGRTENHKGPLPLSLFGDEETEADDPMIH